MIFFKKKKNNPLGDTFISFFRYSRQQMNAVFLGLLSLQFFVKISSSLISIPVIRNVSLKMSGYNSTTINSTCHECFCAMLLNKTSISSFNCIHKNQTCELFSLSLNTTSFSLISDTTSSVYFKSIPSIISISTVPPTDQATSSLLSKS